MKKYLFALFATFLPLLSFSAEEGISKKIDDVFRPIADAVGGIVFYSVQIVGMDVPVVLFVLIGGALFFTFYFAFPNIRLNWYGDSNC